LAGWRLFLVCCSDIQTASANSRSLHRTQIYGQSRHDPADDAFTDAHIVQRDTRSSLLIPNARERYAQSQPRRSSHILLLLLLLSLPSPQLMKFTQKKCSNNDASTKSANALSCEIVSNSALFSLFVWMRSDAVRTNWPTQALKPERKALKGCAHIN
jgi:hypothetical protein